MTGIRVATLLHFLWGIYLVLFWYRVPTPFGAFEPFLDVVTPYQLGCIFLTISLLAAAKNLLPHKSSWYFSPLLAVPQQVILVWGLLGGISYIYQEHIIDRSYLSLCYMVSITVFHTVDCFRLWQHSIISRGYR